MNTATEKVTTVFDLVELVQKRCRGQHFCEVRLEISDTGIISFSPCSYSPKQHPSWSKVVEPQTLRFIVLENFLQYVRTFFPGISFQLIELSVFGGFIRLDAISKPVRTLAIAF